MTKFTEEDAKELQGLFDKAEELREKIQYFDFTGALPRGDLNEPETLEMMLNYLYPMIKRRQEEGLTLTGFKIEENPPSTFSNPHNLPPFKIIAGFYPNA